jgi:hypothetical protein
MQNIAHLSQKPTLRAATPPTADPGAARLRPSTLSSHVQRATFNLQPLAPHAAPATAPAAGPGAAPLRPSTLSSHVQRATFNLQPLAPRASYTSRSVRWKRERNSTP